jgi:hypothetical protein
MPREEGQTVESQADATVVEPARDDDSVTMVRPDQK